MTAKELTALVQELVAKVNELEQRSSNFAARINALNRASRDEIKALREEVAVFKALPMNTRREPLPLLPAISTKDWMASIKALKAVPGETRGFFPPAEIRGMSLKMSALQADALAEICDDDVEM